MKTLTVSNIHRIGRFQKLTSTDTKKIIFTLDKNTEEIKSSPASNICSNSLRLCELNKLQLPKLVSSRIMLLKC